MNALQVMDRYRKVVILVIQVSTEKNDIKVQYLYGMHTLDNLVLGQGNFVCI